MKVKVFNFYRKGVGFWYAPPADEVESALQEWLDNNPDVKIEHVVQTPVGNGPEGSTSNLLTTIFYRD